MSGSPFFDLFIIILSLGLYILQGPPKKIYDSPNWVHQKQDKNECVFLGFFIHDLLVLLFVEFDAVNHVGLFRFLFHFLGCFELVVWFQSFDFWSRRLHDGLRRVCVLQFEFPVNQWLAWFQGGVGVVEQQLAQPVLLLFEETDPGVHEVQLVELVVVVNPSLD